MSFFLRHSRQNQLTLEISKVDSLLSYTPPCTPIAKTPTPVFRKGPDDSRIYQPVGHPKQCVIDGEIWPPVFIPANVRSAKAMEPRDDDIFICTYPKCGTTWLQHIVHQLMRREKYQTGEGKEMCFQSPMIERMGAPFAEAIDYPRILKTHFNFMNIPKSDDAKYIFCVRNPKDCLISYFHHNCNFKIYDFEKGDFDEFFELFISGQLAFGDYFDHLLGWLPYANSLNVLFLTYEEMYGNLEKAVYRIGEFLGGEAADLVNCTQELQLVVENSKIGAMKKDQSRWFPGSILHSSSFIRKGGSRDWKNYLSREQSDRLDTVYRTRCAGTAAEHWWKKEMDWEDPAEEDDEDEDEEVEKEEKPIVSLALPIIVDSDDSGIEEDLEMMEGSVSRRASISLNDREKELMCLPENPQMVRRFSFNSLSTGYGSIW